MNESSATETPIDEIYRIRRMVSAEFCNDPDKLFRAVSEQQKQDIRDGQVFWGFDDAGKLAPIPGNSCLD